MSNIEQVKELRERTNLSLAQCNKAITEANGNIDTAIELLKKWGTLKSQDLSTRQTSEGKVSIFANNSATTVGISEVNCQTDFLAKSPEFAELVDSFSKMSGFSDDAFEAKRQELAAKTGENIVLRRKEVWYVTDSNEFIHWYVYQNEKIGVLLTMDAIKSDRTVALADDIAVHIAATNPLYLTATQIPQADIDRQTELFKAQCAGKLEASIAKIVEGKLAKWRSEMVLLEQGYVQNEKKTIQQLCDEVAKSVGSNVTVKHFVRYEVGK